MIIINNLFWVGTAIVILAMFGGFGLANNYASKRAKLICIMHFIGLCMMGFGISDIARSYGFQNSWWETGGQALFFILGFGAFLEYQKMLPMAPKNIQNMAERVATEAGQMIIGTEPKHPTVEGFKQTVNAKPTYQNVSNIQYETLTARTVEPADEDMYEIALNELDNDKQVSAIYAKALALSQGDTDKARWKYVDLRVSRLKEQEVGESARTELLPCAICGRSEAAEILTDGACEECRTPKKPPSATGLKGHNDKTPQNEGFMIPLLLIIVFLTLATFGFLINSFD